jgi:hypothetical protein
VSFLRWFGKETPAVWELPGAGTKPLKDFTDDDVEGAVTDFYAERIQGSSMEKYVDYDELLGDAYRMRARERQRISRSRLSLGFSRMRFWVRMRWWDWRSREDEADYEIAVDVAGVTLPEVENPR